MRMTWHGIVGKGSGIHTAGGLGKKKFPGFRGVENSGADSFSIPAGIFPLWLDVQDRDPGIVIGENGQLSGAPVQLFWEITQTDAAE